MTIFICDNNIDGLLSSLFISFIDKVKPSKIIDRTIYQPRFDAYIRQIKTDKEQAERVKKALYSYGGDDFIAHLKLCLSSCDINALTIAFNYAHLTLTMRTDVSEYLSEKSVSDFSYVVQKVLHERHIICGLLRFKESASGILYATYSPDNDITSILAPHFLRRLGHIPFIIHDVKRNKIAISNGKAIKIDYTNIPSNFISSKSEDDINALWKNIFRL